MHNWYHSIKASILLCTRDEIVIYMADSLLPLFPLLPLLPLFPLVHLLGTLLAVTGSNHLVPRLLINWPLVPLFSPCSSQPKIPTPRGFPDPNMYLIRTTLRTQPQMLPYIYSGSYVWIMCWNYRLLFYTERRQSLYCLLRRVTIFLNRF